ncbi:hypothetical protein CEQ90_05485 [Lewinellaceae bacterium SD302]|nr:hypothetical protein CEQ90_05485 [Lewinellaceae bacterium SD302]
MSLPFQDLQVKERLLPILWQELLAKVEREVAPATLCNDLTGAIYVSLPAKKINKQTLSLFVNNEGFPLDTSTEIINKVARYLGYGNWPNFVTEKRIEKQPSPRQGGPDRDGGGFMFWGP